MGQNIIAQVSRVTAAARARPDVNPARERNMPPPRAGAHIDGIQQESGFLMNVETERQKAQSPHIDALWSHN